MPVISLLLFFTFYLKPTWERNIEHEERLIERRETIESRNAGNGSDIDSRLANVERKQETLVNDMRQEINNVIEKANLWMTFWLAIIAIFGAFIPVLIQYRLYIINREKLLQEMAYYHDFLRANSIHNISGNFTMVSNLQVVIDSSIRQTLLYRFINNAAGIFEEIVQSISKNYNGTLTPDIISLLIQALIQISVIAQKVGDHVPRAHRREFNSISDDIKTMIDTLTAIGKPGRCVQADDLIHKMHHLSSKICGLTRCLD